MAVKIESFGYPAVFDEAGEVISGAIDARVGAKYWPALASGRFSALGPDDWKVTAQAGIDRGIRVNAGTLVGDAVMDRLPTYDTFSLPAVVSGVRWFMVVARRSWTDPALTSIRFIEGPTTAAVPTELPARSDDPGAESDQPIALCLVSSTATVITTIIDLRVIGGSDIYHRLALEYLENTAQPVKLGSSLWRWEQVDPLGSWQHREYLKYERPVSVNVGVPTGWRVGPAGFMVVRTPIAGNLSLFHLTAQVIREGEPFAIGNKPLGSILPAGFRPRDSLDFHAGMNTNDNVYLGAFDVRITAGGTIILNPNDDARYIIEKFGNINFSGQWVA